MEGVSVGQFRVPNPLLWKMVGCTIPKKHGNFTSGPSRAFIWSRTGKRRWKLARWVSHQEILLWLHSDSFTESRDTAILPPPPICHFVSDHWRQRICSIFQLDFSYFYVSHLCAPLIWHFDAAHFEQHRICSNFSLQAASDLFQFFNVPVCICGQGLFHICSHHDFRFYRALQFVLRMFSN